MNYWSKTPADSTMSTTENPNADSALKPPSHKNTNYVMAGVLFPQLTRNRAFRCSLTRSRKLFSIPNTFKQDKFHALYTLNKVPRNVLGSSESLRMYGKTFTPSVCVYASNFFLQTLLKEAF